MARKLIDRIVVRELFDGGTSVTDIATQLRCGKGTISKILSEMGLVVVKAAVAAAPKYVERKDIATEHLSYLIDKAKAELEWIEGSEKNF